MRKVFALVGGAALFAAQGVSAGDSVSQASSFEEFSQQFCAASQAGEHVFVLPAKVFAEHTSLTCDSGEFTLRTGEPTDDPGHTVYNIDPPSGVDLALDCDAKADTGMSVIALNCLSVAAESEDHD